MNTYTRTLYHQFSSINNPIEKFAAIMNTQLEYCARVFGLADDNRQPSWLNSFSKMLNMRKIDTALSQKTKKNKKSCNQKSNLLTQKGMHCVQFVTTVFQIAELHESQYQTFYKVSHSFEHFSLKHGNTSKTKSPYVLEKFHNAFSCFKEHYFPQSLIPLSGKTLSPAALLMYFTCPPYNHCEKKFFIQSSIPSYAPRFEQLILSLKTQTFVDPKEVSRSMEAKELDTTALLSTLCIIKKQESEKKQKRKKGRKRKNVENAILYSKSNSVDKKSSKRKRVCLAL